MVICSHKGIKGATVWLVTAAVPASWAAAASGDNTV